MLIALPRRARSALSRSAVLMIRSQARSWSHPLPVEFGATSGAVAAQRALGAGCVRSYEDPVLPGGEPGEDPRLHGLRADEPVVRLHPGERVGGQRRPLLQHDPDL